MMTYQEALDYIHSVNWRGSRPGLSRITELLSKLQNPEQSLRCIHIAGTNGKGSTSAMLTAVLLEAGYSVGTFTSPFIESFNERIMKDGLPIPDGDLCRGKRWISCDRFKLHQWNHGKWTDAGCKRDLRIASGR